MRELEGTERKAFISGAWRGAAVAVIWCTIALIWFLKHGS
jgi:hypothetical protein